MDDTQASKGLLADHYHEFVADLDALYLASNISGRLKFAQKWPTVAKRMFGEVISDFDVSGDGDRSQLPELERQAEARRLALLEIVSDLEARSLDHGTLRHDFVRRTIDQVGEEIAELLYVPDIIEKVKDVPSVGTPEDVGSRWFEVEAEVETGTVEKELEPLEEAEKELRKSQNPQPRRRRARAQNILSQSYSHSQSDAASGFYAGQPLSRELTEPYPYSDVIDKLLEVKQKLSHLPAIMQRASQIMMEEPELERSAPVIPRERPKIKMDSVSLPKLDVLDRVVAAFSAFKAQAKAEISDLIQWNEDRKARKNRKPGVVRKRSAATSKTDQPEPQSRAGSPAAKPAEFDKSQSEFVPSPPVSRGFYDDDFFGSGPLRTHWWSALRPLSLSLEGFGALAYKVPFLDRSYNPLVIMSYDWTYLVYFLRHFDGAPAVSQAVVSFSGIGSGFFHDWGAGTGDFVQIANLDESLEAFWDGSFVEEDVLHDELLPDIGFYLDDAELYL